MSKYSLAIVTPVYNRANELPSLFDSLAAQDNKSFAWYVVDDGSDDGSWRTINELALRAPFETHIYRKNNGGKHTAVNYVMCNVKERMTFIVDSDDTLPKDSIATILRAFGQIEGDEGLCGISFLRRMTNASQKSDFPETNLRGSYVDVRINEGVDGDKAEVFYTRCLKEVPFPEFAGEKFYHEDGVWVRLSRKYEMLHVNKTVYEGRYLEDGLTRSGRTLKLTSPLGMIDRSEQFLTYPGYVCLEQRIKHALLWNVYTQIALKKGVRAHGIKAPSPVLCSILAVPAMIVRYRWENEVRA